jgi:replicative DNA helicase
LTVNLAETALKNGTAVAMFSLEMSRSEILRRLLACNAGVQGEHLLRGPLTEQQFVKVVDATTMIANWQFYVDEAVDASIYDIRSRARRLHNRLPDGLGLIIVDYLQLLRPLDARGNRTQEVAAMTRGLKTLAKELRIPVICVSQLNRDLEKRADRRPQLSDLRDSGAVEQDADMVLFLYREGYYDKEVDPSVTELNIAKHRNGRLGQVELTFLAHYPKFTPSAAAVNTESAAPF